ncbi:TIGR04283 family arsenosugar biosynthesis glycosyltransferase [Litchfieldella xinjiangensis]|uniref:TIGR04283 family arsenosugar biosynthesis glycosyltransferase n=1 Tax=Litchfieldella xinjiangensis TaxID=1166948 RepID=UPI0005BB505C|nr:TIGR04283 family arsenosugar biosynthesis glycosyltransferase [Halomonas xinjiangensis]
MSLSPRPVPLSVIVPTLDEALGIKAHLSALAHLRERGAEVVVVDGGSRDDTVRRAAPWCDRVMASPAGRARQMNAGALASQGAIVVFLHADTRLPEDADQCIYQALATGAAWGRFDIRLTGQARLLPVIARCMNARSRLTGIATGDQALFMTRDAFERAGSFPEQPLMEDIEMSRRLKALSRPVCLHQCVISSGRRWERHGVWRTILLMWRLRYRYWRGVDSAKLAKVYRHAR